MSFHRVAAAIFLLALSAKGQVVHISDIQSGSPATAVIRDAQPGALATFTLQLLNEQREAVQLRYWVERTNSYGRASITTAVPVNTKAEHWQITVQTTGAQRNFSVQSLAGPVMPAGPIPHHPASDFFDGTHLHPSWSQLHPALMDFEVSNSALHLTPTQTGPTATWVGDNEGPFIYKTIHGDFDVQSTVHAESSLNPGTDVPIRFRLGGLMVRNPNSAPGNRSSAHVVIGGGNSNFPIAVEDKTTFASASDWFFQAIPTMDLELRITRVGDLISRMYRVPGAPMWTLINSDFHPEFGPTAQVGMMAYSFDAPADIRVSIDEIVFY